jgi:hypothetical protein
MLTAQKNLPSDRNFGVLFAVVSTLLAAHFHWNGTTILAVIICGILALAFLLAALFAPDSLRRLNRAWHWFGIAVGRVVSPMVLGAIFFLLLTPIALVMRAFGRDALNLRGPRNVISCWVPRGRPGPDSASFKNQF